MGKKQKTQKIEIDKIHMYVLAGVSLLHEDTLRHYNDYMAFCTSMSEQDLYKGNVAPEIVTTTPDSILEYLNTAYSIGTNQKKNILPMYQKFSAVSVAMFCQTPSPPPEDSDTNTNNQPADKIPLVFLAVYKFSPLVSELKFVRLNQDIENPHLLVSAYLNSLKTALTPTCLVTKQNVLSDKETFLLGTLSSPSIVVYSTKLNLPCLPYIECVMGKPSDRVGQNIIFCDTTPNILTNIEKLSAKISVLGHKQQNSEDNNQELTYPTIGLTLAEKKRSVRHM